MDTVKLQQLIQKLLNVVIEIIKRNEALTIKKQTPIP